MRLQRSMRRLVPIVLGLSLIAAIFGPPAALGVFVLMIIAALEWGPPPSKKGRNRAR